MLTCCQELHGPQTGLIEVMGSPVAAPSIHVAYHALVQLVAALHLVVLDVAPQKYLNLQKVIQGSSEALELPLLPTVPSSVEPPH